MVERLEELARQANTPPWHGLREAWHAFAAELEADFTGFERELLLSANKSLVQREHARRVTQEHAAARALVDEIGRQITRHQPRAATFDLLAELLREREANRARRDPLS